MKGLLLSSLLSLITWVAIYPIVNFEKTDERINTLTAQIDSIYLEEIRVTRLNKERAKVLHSEIILTECLVAQLEIAINLEQHRYDTNIFNNTQHSTQ